MSDNVASDDDVLFEEEKRELRKKEKVKFGEISLLKRLLLVMFSCNR